MRGFVRPSALGEQAPEPGVAAAGQLDLGCQLQLRDHHRRSGLKCWGYGADGELGLPGVSQVGVTNTPAAEPPIDLGSGFTAKAIGSGDYHTCAIRNDNSLVCWGYGANGRLGYGNTTDVGVTNTAGSEATWRRR